MTAQAIAFTLSLLAYAAQRDIAVEELCALAEVDLTAVLQKDFTNVSPENVESLWKYASDLSNDPLFGLHFGESLQVAALGIVGEIIKSSNSVGEALQIAISLVPLITDRFTMGLLNKRTTCHIFLTPKDDQSHLDFFDEQMADFLMAFTIHELDGLLLRKLRPEEVFLPKIPDNCSEYRRVLRCDQIKKGAYYSISLNLEILKTPIFTRNHQIQKVLLEKIKNAPDDWPIEKVAFYSRVHSYLVTNSYLKVPTLEETASNFNMSPRTFQRRLKEEEKSFQQIADAVKKHLAITYMETSRYPIKEISYILGYNDHSAFSRAFKRWTGKAPIDFS